MLRRRSSFEETDEFQLTSLIDCVFLLLIFFMTTTVFKNPSALKTVLPVAESSMLVDERKLIAEIDADGLIALNGTRVYLDNFDAQLARDKEQKGSNTLIIHADKEAKHGIILDVMKLAKSIGIDKITMATDDPRESRVVTEEQ